MSNHTVFFYSSGKVTFPDVVWYNECMENILIPSTKGLLATVIHRPKKETDKLAILCPGYLDSKDYKHLVMLADDLAQNGYTVVRFDPVGTWESEGDISEHKIPNELDDIGAILEYMLSQRAYKTILLGGHSRGGFISMLYAVSDPRITHIFGIMSPYSFKRTVDDERMKLWREQGFRESTRDIPDSHEFRKFVMPYENMLADAEYNLLDVIDKLHVPLLLIAGEEDDTVLPEDVKLLFEKANEPKQFEIVQGIDHGYRRSADEVKKVNKIIILWQSKYNHE